MTCRRWSSSFCLSLLLLSSNIWLPIFAASFQPTELIQAETGVIESEKQASTELPSSRDEMAQALIASVRAAIDSNASPTNPPTLKEVSQMRWYEVADALKLRTTPGGRFVTNFGPDSLIEVVVRNFRMACFHDVSQDEIRQLKLAGYRHQRYNRNVLDDMIKDGGRFLRYLGFKGCLELVKRILDYLSGDLNSSSVHQAIKMHLTFSVGSLENFVKHVLYTQTAPYHFIRGDPEYNYEHHCEVELTHYEAVRQIATPVIIAQIKSKNLLKIIIERFKRWLPDAEIFSLFAEFYRNCYHHEVGYFKTVIYPIVRDNPDAFVNPSMIPNRYARLINRDCKLPVYYGQMVPVLRALMMIDALPVQRSYLTAYFSKSDLHYIGRDKQGPILRILDLMLAETKFAVFDMNKEFSHRLSVLRIILMGMGLSVDDALLAAVSRGLVNVAESLLVLHSMEWKSQRIILYQAVESERNTGSLENLSLAVAYAVELDAPKMRAYASRINLDDLLQDKEWKLVNRIDYYNRMATLKHMMLHVADILEVLGNPRSTRSVFAQYENEVISLPCPIGIIDFLLPELKTYRKNPAPLDLQPFSLLLIVMQVILKRVFGIPMMETRFVEDSADIYDWREAVDFANFMIAKHAKRQLVHRDEDVPDLETRMDLKVVRFVDPAFEVAMSQIRRQTSEDELASLYREVSSNSCNSSPRQGASSAETTKADECDDFVFL